MDPHTTEADVETPNFSPHRSLDQNTDPAPSPSMMIRKKKFVTFKISRRIRSMKGDEGRRGSSCPSTSTVNTTDLTHASIMKMDNSERDERKAGRDFNWNSQEQEDGDRCDGESHETLTYLDGERKESRGVKEKGHDTRRVFKRSRQDSREVNERRNGILHLKAGPEDDLRDTNKDAKDHSGGEVDNQPSQFTRSENNGMRVAGSLLKPQSVHVDGDLNRRPSIPDDISLGQASIPTDNFLDRHIAMAEERNLRKRPPISENRNHLARQSSIPEECRHDSRPTSVGEKREVGRRPSAPEESQRVIANKTTSSATLETSQPTRRRRAPEFATTHRSQSVQSTSSWVRVRNAIKREGGDAMTQRLSSVVELVTSRRRKSQAPTIWTPAVKRSPPGPRPANFSDQEETGRKRLVISFIVRASNCPRSYKRPPHQPSLLYPVSASQWEASGKQYVSWISNLVANPLLQEGHLLKGLEIGVQYPAVFLKEVQTKDSAMVEGNRRLLEESLGPDCIFHQGVYEEVISWVPKLLVSCPSDPSQWARCYILLGFMTLEGSLDKKMEVLWKDWTGALYVYCNIDDELGLKKLNFYRRSSGHQANLFSYLVFVELDTVTRKNGLLLLDFVYRMRLKNMAGYISVYQSHYPDTDVFIVPGGSPASFRPLSPLGKPQSSLDRAQSPFGRAQSPLGRAQSPLGGAQSPLGGAQSPLGGAQSPLGRAQTPRSRAQSPFHRTQSPANGNYSMTFVLPRPRQDEFMIDARIRLE